MSSLTATVALPILARLKEREREYDAEREQWAAKGYRPPTCIHGTSLWVDYDNICAGCEAGLSVYEEALHAAHAAINESNRRTAIVSAMLAAALEKSGTRKTEIPQPIIDALFEWSLDPVGTPA